MGIESTDQNIVYVPLPLLKPQLDIELPTPTPPTNNAEWRYSSSTWYQTSKSVLYSGLAFVSFCVVVAIGFSISLSISFMTSDNRGTLGLVFNSLSLFVCVLPLYLSTVYGCRNTTLASQFTAFLVGEMLYIPYALGLVGISTLVFLPAWGVHSVGIFYAVICFCALVFCATAGYFLQFVVFFLWVKEFQNRLTPVALALALGCGFNFLFVIVGSSAWTSLLVTTYWLDSYDYAYVEVVIITVVPVVNIVAAGLVGKGIGEHKFAGKCLLRAIAPALFFLFSFYFIIIVVFMPILFLVSDFDMALYFWLFLSLFVGLVYGISGFVALIQFRAKALVAIQASSPVVLHQDYSLQ